MYCRAFILNWAQNAPLFAELTQQNHHILRVLAIFIQFLRILKVGLLMDKQP